MESSHEQIPFSARAAGNTHGSAACHSGDPDPGPAVQPANNILPRPGGTGAGRYPENMPVSSIVVSHVDLLPLVHDSGRFKDEFITRSPKDWCHPPAFVFAGHISQNVATVGLGEVAATEPSIRPLVLEPVAAAGLRM
jgi:hypothetical protein